MNSLLRYCLRQFFEIPKAPSRVITTDSLSSRICHSCKLTAPSTQELITLMRERNLVSFHQMTKSEDNRGCKFLNTFEFKPQVNCFLANKLTMISIELADGFSDIRFLDKSSMVFLEALKMPPKEKIGDLTGDYGKETVNFLVHCFQNNFLSDVGTIVDVGGRSIAATLLIRKFFKEDQIPSLIIDINILTPFLSKQQTNIFYAIGGAKEFFECKDYDDEMKKIESEKPTLFLLSNFLSVLKADDGWDTLKVCWSKLRSNDILIISNVVAKPLKKQNMVKTIENDGLSEYAAKIGNLSKTAIEPNFIEFLERKLGAQVICHKPYEYAIETKREAVGSISGIHLLAIKKI